MLSSAVYQLHVWLASFPPLVSLYLLIYSRPLCPLLRLIRTHLVSQSLCIQSPCPNWPPQISQKSLSFWLNSSKCVYTQGVGLCTMEVCGSFYLTELLNPVWQECLHYYDHLVSVIPHLCNSAAWKYSRLRFLSILLLLIYKWIHLVFMRGLGSRRDHWIYPQGFLTLIVSKNDEYNNKYVYYSE